jgi:hypothetical protein
MLLAVTAPVDRFIEDLRMAGEAMPQGLTTLEAPFRRYRPAYPISLKAIRIPREWVQELLPPVDRLLYEISNGGHQDLQDFLAERSTDRADMDNNQKDEPGLGEPEPDGHGKPNPGDNWKKQWWAKEYDPVELANNIAAKIFENSGNIEDVSSRKIAAKVSARMQASELSSGRDRKAPSADRIRKTALLGWRFVPD